MLEQFNKENIITGNAFKNICDDFLDEEKTYIDITKKPKNIFLKTDWIEIFKNKILPKIDYQFNLITHNADRPAPSNNIDLLDDKRLLKWFGMNCHSMHPKLQPIPIGIANEKWPHGNKDTLLKIINENNEKKNFIYCNFDIKTNLKERSATYNVIKELSFIDFETQKLTFEDYLRKLSTYKYVISPPGNSVDCHRIWESIYVGTIPIVQKSIPMMFFKDCPILFVDKWEELYNIDLENIYNDVFLKSKDKSNFNFYKNLIASA